MAVLGNAGVLPALNFILADRIYRNFASKSVLFNLLRHRQDGNTTCSWSAKGYTRTAGGAYAPGAAFDASEIDSNTRVQATLQWANYRELVEVADETGDIVAATGGSEGFDLLIEEIKDASDALAVKLGAALYSGTGAGSPNLISGLALAIDGSDDNYAGVDTGVNTWFVSGETAASAGLSGVTKAELRETLIRPVRNATQRNPDCILVPGAVFDGIASLFDDNSPDIKSLVNMAGRTTAQIEALAGARYYSLDGVPIIEDVHCTAGVAYAVTLDALSFAYVPIKATRPPPQQLAQAVQALSGAERIPNVSDVAAAVSQMDSMFRPLLVQAGKLGTSERLALRTGNVQLKIHARNAHAKLTGLT